LPFDIAMLDMCSRFGFELHRKTGDEWIAAVLDNGLRSSRE
jgi:hypothetical protein